MSAGRGKIFFSQSSKNLYSSHPIFSCLYIFPFSNSKKCLLHSEMTAQFKPQINFFLIELAEMAKQDCYLSDSDILSLSLCRPVHLAVAFLNAGYVRSSWCSEDHFHPQLGILGNEPLGSTFSQNNRAKVKRKAWESLGGKYGWFVN